MLIQRPVSASEEREVLFQRLDRTWKSFLDPRIPRIQAVIVHPPCRPMKPFRIMGRRIHDRLFEPEVSISTCKSRLLHQAPSKMWRSLLCRFQIGFVPGFLRVLRSNETPCPWDSAEYRGIWQPSLYSSRSDGSRPWCPNGSFRGFEPTSPLPSEICPFFPARPVRLYRL